MDAVLFCPACAWFGVYRADVAGSIGGCPSCGKARVEQRALDDPRIHEFGNHLLSGLDSPRGPQAPPPPARQ